MESKRASPSPTALAVSRARTAFTINTTISGHEWRLRQLYGLCELLVQHREQLIQALCGKQLYLQTKYEQELSVVHQDIARHYVGTAESKPLFSTPVSHQVLPVGVSVLLVNSANPVRFLFSTLAANLALGNTVVLASNATYLDKFWLILQREAPRYLDREAIQVLWGLDLNESLFEKVDLVSIFDESSEPYTHVLHRPDVQFISAKLGSSLLVIGEGGKSYDKIAGDIIRSYSFRDVRPEAVSAVFIREVEMDKYRKSFNATPTPDIGNFSTTSLDQTTVFTRFSSYSYSVDLARLVGPGEKELSLAKALEVTARAGILLVVSYRTIEHVITALRRLKPTPMYLTLLQPKDLSNSEYFAKWTASRYFSLGSIRPVFPYGSPSDVLFPLNLFARSRISFTTQQPELEQPLDAVLRKVRKVVKLPKEAPNQTVDFFQYMNRVAAGLAFGSMSLIGIYIWWTRSKAT